MKIPPAIHPWSVTPKRAVEIQRELANKVISKGRIRNPRLVAGADLAFSTAGDECFAGVVVWDVVDQRVVERCVARRKVRFPYVPGLLSFREAPAILAALRKIRCEPDAFMFDGQGYSHPRRFGLASHLGVLIDRPSVGCAKSLLIGQFDEPAQAKGSVSALWHQDERIGLVVRTRAAIKPVFVSVGNRISLHGAVAIVLACCTQYRIPEPTRLADQLVANASRGP